MVSVVEIAIEVELLDGEAVAELVCAHILELLTLIDCANVDQISDRAC